MLFLLAVTYGTVFTAELIGDKLLYTISMLGARYRSSPVFFGVGLAFMAKMAAAVFLGGLVARLPANVVAVISAGTFFMMALALWFKAPESGSPERDQSAHWPRAAMLSFCVVFFSEWGDMGQVTAAALAARYAAPLVVWLGATMAMMTKAMLALTLGRGLRNRVSESILRYCGVSILLALGVLSLIRF